MGRRDPLDKTGSLLLIVCFCAFIVGLSHLNEWGAVSEKTGLAAMLFLVGAFGLVGVETRAAHPIFDPSLESFFMAAFHRAMQAGAMVAGFGIAVAYLRGRDSGRAVRR